MCYELLTAVKEGWTTRRPKIMQASLLRNPRALSFLIALVLLMAMGVASVNADWDKDEDNDSGGYLGVYMQKLTKDISKGLDLDVKRGVLINGVEDGSPADEAGIEDGDVIIEFDGTKIDSPEDLRELVEDTAVGKEVKVKVIRDGDEKTLHVIVGERPKKLSWTFSDDDGDFFVDIKDNVHGALAGLWPGPSLGVKAVELNEDLASYFDTDEDGGVLVLDVEDESVAQEAGVEAGDVIQVVDGEDVSSVDELRHSLKGFEKGDEFDVVIIRHGKKKTLTATMGEQRRYKVLRGGDFHFEKFDRPHVKIKKFDDGDRMFIDKENLREEMKNIKKELKELKKELKKLRKD